MGPLPMNYANDELHRENARLRQQLEQANDDIHHLKVQASLHNVEVEQAVSAERDLVLKIIKDTAERYWRGEWPELSLGDAIEQAIRKGRGE